MIGSFYNARSGVLAYEKTMTVISNNLANLNTGGYKREKMGFADLLYSNLNLSENSEEPDPVRSGSGVKNQQVTVAYTQGGFEDTQLPFDYAVQGEGYFAIQNRNSGDIFYTRDGAFRKTLLDGTFYLTNAEGDFVLNRSGTSIAFDPVWPSEESKIGMEQLQIGVFRFSNQYGLMKHGRNQFEETMMSGEAELMANPVLKKGYLERSNVDMSAEISRVIETQRAYQINSRLIQISDELEQTLNNLR